MSVASAGPCRLLVVVVVVAVTAIALPPRLSATSAARDYPSQHLSGRVRRQLPPLDQGNQVIDNIFQIPISTLNAVGSLIKSTRPLVRRTRERIQQYYSGVGGGQLQQQQQQYGSVGVRPGPVQSYVSSYGNRPYYSSTYYSNRRKQQRDDPLPEGRHHRGHGEDY